MKGKGRTEAKPSAEAIGPSSSPGRLARGWRRLLLALVALSLLAFAADRAVRWWFVSGGAADRARAYIEEDWAPAAGLRAEIGEVSFGLAQGVLLSDVQLGPASDSAQAAAPVLRAAQVRIDLNLWALARHPRDPGAAVRSAQVKDGRLVLGRGPGQPPLSLGFEGSIAREADLPAESSALAAAPALAVSPQGKGEADALALQLAILSGLPQSVRTEGTIRLGADGRVIFEQLAVTYGESRARVSGWVVGSREDRPGELDLQIDSEALRIGEVLPVLLQLSGTSAEGEGEGEAGGDQEPALPAWAQGVRGVLAGRGRLWGPYADAKALQFDGQLKVTDAAWGTVAAEQLEAHTRWDGKTLWLENLKAQAFGGAVTGTVSVDTLAKAYVAELQGTGVEGASIGALGGQAFEDAALSGTFDVQASVRGTLPGGLPTGTVSFSAAPASAYGYAMRTLQATLDLRTEPPATAEAAAENGEPQSWVVEVREATGLAQASGGEAKGSGNLRFAWAPSAGFRLAGFSVALEGRGLDPSGDMPWWPKGLPFALQAASFRGEIAGSSERWEIAGLVEAASGSISGQPVGETRAHIAFRSGPPPFELEWTDLRAQLPGPSGGFLAGSGVARWPIGEEGETEISGDLRIESGSPKAQPPQGAAEVKARFGSAADPELASQLQVSVVGRSIDLASLSSLLPALGLPAIPDLSGTLRSLEVRVEGPSSNPSASGKLDIRDLALGAYRVRRVSGSVRLNDGVLTTPEIQVVSGNSRALVRGELVRLKPAPALNFAIDAREVALSDLLAVLGHGAAGQQGLTGSLSGRVLVTGTPARPQLRADLGLVGKTANGLPVEASVAAALDPLALAVERLTVRSGARTWLSGSGKLALKSPAGGGPVAAGGIPGGIQRLALQVYELPAELLTAVIPGATVQGSEVRGHISLAGSLQDPQLSGQLEVAASSVHHPSMPADLRALAAQIRLEGERVTLASLTARSGPGEVRGSGQVTVRSLSPVDISQTALQLDFSDFTFATEALSGRLTGTTTVSGPWGQGRYPKIVGTLALSSGEMWIQGEGITDALSRLIAAAEGRPGSSRDQGAAARLRSGRQTPPMALDLVTTAVDPLRVSVPVISAELTALGELRVTGTLDRPALAGTARLLRGRMRYFGNDFTIQSGTAHFHPSRGTEPELDVVAGTTVAGVEVTLALRGTPDQLTPVLSSNPELPEQVLANMLAAPYGVAPEQVADGWRLQDSWLRLVDAPLAGMVIQPVEGALRRALALDEVRLQPDFGEKRLVLSVGKYVLNGLVFVSYTRTLFGAQPDHSLDVQFTSGPGIRWTAGVGEDGYHLGLQARIEF